MNLLIAAVGKAKHAPEAELVGHYLKRTRWDVSVKEIPDAPANLSADARRAKEGEAILKLADKGRLIAMDSTGQSVTSEQFAALISRAEDASVKTLVFAIGGQDGLAPEVLQRASGIIAFGGVTWPHQLLRAMLAEQIYRAWTIKARHPYHLGH